MWAVLACLAWGTAAYLAIGISPAEAWRMEAERRYNPPRPLRERVVAWFLNRGGLLAQIRHELEVTDQDAWEFAVRAALFSAIGAFAGGVDFGPWLAPVGAAAGFAGARLLLLRRYRGWTVEVIGGMADLVLLLKARLQAGDTVDQAVEAVVPHLPGALRVEWERVAALRRSGMPLREALWQFGDRVYDRDVAAVIAQLAGYDREAVPEDPFGALAAHIARIQGMRREYVVRRATSSITAYAGLALFSAMVSVIAPQLYLLWVQSLSMIPF